MGRGEIKPRDWVLSSGLFILVIFAVTWAVSGAAVENSDFIDETQLDAYNNTFNKFDTYNTRVGDLKEGTQLISAGEGGVFSFLNNLINQGWQLLVSLFDSFIFFNEVLDGLASQFGLPTFIPELLISLVSVMFAFSILAVIFNREV